MIPVVFVKATRLRNIGLAWGLFKSRAAKRGGGGFQTGGFPDLDLFLSFFVLFCPFWDFPDFCRDYPDLLGDGPGIFPIRPFSLSRPIKSTCEEQSRKGPRHNLDLSRKKLETPRLSFSQLRGGFHTPVRGTMFVRNGAVTPGPSRECDITFFVKGRPKSAQQSRDSTVAAHRVQRVTVPSSWVSRECRLPG